MEILKMVAAAKTNEIQAHDALSLSYDEWRALIVDTWKEPRFRVDQVCGWIYDKKIFDCHAMTNLSKTLRDRLNYEMPLELPIQIKELKSKDGTRKYLWQMKDGSRIESVLLDHLNHTTACISSQAGCPLACSFCATGQGGYTRDLTTGEILGQFLFMEQRLGRDINNVVFMGMGEPLLNEEAVFKSIRTLNHEKMRNLGGRHITVSTSGIVPGIKDLADFEVPIRLSVSLHAPNDALRNKLMPVNRKYPLSALVDALHYYKKRTGERITIEYVLIDGLNDDAACADQLASILRNFQCHVNVIPLNSVKERNLRASPEKKVAAFVDRLAHHHISVTRRREMGDDIQGACGQLRNSILMGGDGEE